MPSTWCPGTTIYYLIIRIVWYVLVEEHSGRVQHAQPYRFTKFVILWVNLGYDSGSTYRWVLSIWCTIASVMYHLSDAFRCLIHADSVPS